MLDDYISIHHIHRKNTEDLGSSSEEEKFKEVTPQIQIETHSCGTDQASEARVDYNLDHDDDDIIAAGEPHVIVIGGGPAGILTAIILRQRGIRVTVLEKMEVRAYVSCDIFLFLSFSPYLLWCIVFTHC